MLGSSIKRRHGVSEKRNVKFKHATDLYFMGNRP